MRTGNVARRVVGAHQSADIARTVYLTRLGVTGGNASAIEADQAADIGGARDIAGGVGIADRSAEIAAQAAGLVAGGGDGAGCERAIDRPAAVSDQTAGLTAAAIRDISARRRIEHGAAAHDADQAPPTITAAGNIAGCRGVGDGTAG